MPWYKCLVNEVGPVSDSSETPDLVVYINLTDEAGSFANTWFYAANGIQNQLLDVGIAAINGRKDVEVAATAPHPGNQPYTDISRIYGLRPQPPEAPTEFHQISLSPGVGNGPAVLMVGWKDNSNNEDSFVVTYSGTRAGGSPDSAGKSVGANSVTASLGLIPEYTYNIHVAAVNSVGETLSNAITVTVPPALPTHPARTITVSSQGTGTSTLFNVHGTGFTPNSLVVIRFTDSQLAQTQFAQTALNDGTFQTHNGLPCVSGIQLTVTAFEDANPLGTQSNAVVTSCP